MSTPNFDERYPAMFQPGGDGIGSPTPAPAATAAGSTASGTAAAAEHGAVSPPHHNPADNPVPEPKLKVEPSPRQDQRPQTSPDAGTLWQPQLWFTALAASAVMIVAGLFALTAQYWLPPAQSLNPADFQGVDLPPWGQSLFSAAPPLIGVGIAILAVLLLFASRHNPARESTRRTGFLALAAVLGIAGWTALFATELFPGVAAAWQFERDLRSALPWPYAVGESGLWLLSLSLLMLAALLMMPRRWPRPVPDMPADGMAGQTDDGVTGLAAPPANTPQASIPGRSVRGLLFGAVAIAGALFAMFAPYLYPAATGVVVVELANGHQTTTPDWAGTTYKLVTPLMAVGTLVIGAALLTLVTAPRTSPAAGTSPQMPNDVEL